MEEDVQQPQQVAFLEPSELGTREYWDRHYTNDIDNIVNADSKNDESQPAGPLDPSDLESWFDDVNAPAKVLKYLNSTTFPLSPNYSPSAQPTLQQPSAQYPRPAISVLDIGTGNGSMLFTLRQQGAYAGQMVGIDYSQASVELARRLQKGYESQKRVDDAEQVNGGGESWVSQRERGSSAIRFEAFDILRDDPTGISWFLEEGGFDLVLDKGTFDAISLSSETITDVDGIRRRPCETYPSKAITMVKPGGCFLITSCNWTEDEVVRWFTEGPGVEGRMEVVDRLKYRSFEFGGKKGQGVSTVCFRKKR